MISNRDLVEKTKPVLKDFYLQVFACLFLASALPQIVLSLSPTNVLLNLVVVCVSAYLQVGIALYCLEVYKGKEVNWLMIFSRFNGFKPVIFHNPTTHIKSFNYPNIWIIRKDKKDLRIH